jgi:hypothetical protein
MDRGIALWRTQTKFVTVDFVERQSETTQRRPEWNVKAKCVAMWRGSVRHVVGKNTGGGGGCMAGASFNLHGDRHRERRHRCKRKHKYRQTSSKYTCVMLKSLGFTCSECQSQISSTKGPLPSPLTKRTSAPTCRSHTGLHWFGWHGPL